MRAFASVVLALSLLSCAGTPSDSYYKALSGISGVRASAMAACASPAMTRAQCVSMRDRFFVPSDAAIETMEAARQQVIATCPTGEAETAACIGAGGTLRRASSAVSVIVADLIAELAKYEVNL